MAAATNASSEANLDTSLHFVTGGQKRATYRPAALRTNSSSRLAQHATLVGSPSTRGPDDRRSEGSRSEASLSSQRRNQPVGRDRSGTVTSIASTATFAAGQGISRDHWQPDASASACTACAKTFTLFDRKHHCRCCGKIFCSAHSSYTVMLSPDATFVKPGGAPQDGQMGRACAHCRREFELFLSPPTVRRPIASSAGEGSRGIAMNVKKEEDEDGRGLPAQSVPTDWTWSTF
ncbi:hypothetical protein BCR37DRAFT_383779 [Protomyces lactucae-debilis]|uniref:FYVE-type domain-containing protein n=1 Tax=Protomyces lactucae-debilis TaxID=2754530 RepID=A0A1Y2EX11_PROLT|nr:uncharacterized protein BCR37DRAFT_383779 [Protomyces lactucae-debilis]ORY76100.1 hypothetical protein BCR37DRAFT_383779 [Protomyces lactucae-debilis]